MSERERERRTIVYEGLRIHELEPHLSDLFKQVGAIDIEGIVNVLLRWSGCIGAQGRCAGRDAELWLLNGCCGCRTCTGQWGEVGTPGRGDMTEAGIDKGQHIRAVVTTTSNSISNILR